MPECLDCGRDLGCEGRYPPSPPTPPPIPSLPPFSTLEVKLHQSEYYTYGSDLFSNAWNRSGTRVDIKGTSWFGMETSVCFIGGADKVNIDVIMNWLYTNGFNAVRIPLAADALLHPTGHPCSTKGDQEGIRRNNLALGAVSYIDQLKMIIKQAGKRGLLILLDLHVLKAGVWPDGGSVSLSERKDLFNAWDRLSSELCDPRAYWSECASTLTASLQLMVVESTICCDRFMPPSFKQM